jgi:DNA-binding NtrC family response regulator
MRTPRILIIDDDEHIRSSLAAALVPMGVSIDMAGSGEEGIARFAEVSYDIALLDFQMPGMNGLEVLRRIQPRCPKTRFIMVTAHGTIDSAVEAMKLGAVDFIQKPFRPDDIRHAVARVVEREAIDAAEAADYPTLIELCKRHVTDRRLEEARAVAQEALSVDPGRPDAYNLLGALLECRGEWVEAQKYYRAALEIEPGYRPAAANLARTSALHKHGAVRL